MVGIDRASWVVRAIAVAVAIALFGLLAAAGAHPRAGTAGCGGVEVSEPPHWHNHQRPPLAIGDSTMLLALDQLARAGYEANAHGCRQLPEAMAVVQARKRTGTLPHMVVVALGADGTLPAWQIGEMLGLLCCKHLLVLVTPRELGGGSGADAAKVRQEAARHPTRIKLLDWVRYSAGRSWWFQPDGLHLTTSGATAFTSLLGKALKYAYPVARHRRPRHPPVH